MSSTDPATSTSSPASRSFSSFKMMTRKRALALKSASAESAARRVMRSSRGKPLTEEGAKRVEEERKVREAGVSIIILWGA